MNTEGLGILDQHALEQAFVFDRAIDATTYRSQLQRLRDERTAAECELSDARFDELEVEGVMAFAEHVLGNMASLWSAPIRLIACAFRPRCFQLAWSGVLMALEPP